MVSNIDETKPITGVDQPAKVMRDNFTIAKIEITELQARKFDTDGSSSLTGTLELLSLTLAELPPASENEGSLVYVSDALPPSPYFSNGIDWQIIGGVGGGTLSNLVEDLSPQLGGNLDINEQSIVSISNGDIPITPNGVGTIILDGLSWPIADGTNGQVLTTDGGGNLSFTTSLSSGIDNVVEDITPELGGQLDALSNKIINLADPTLAQDAATKDYVDTEILSASSTVNIVNDTSPELGGNLDVNGSSIISIAAGDIAITPDSSGSIVLDGLSWPQADGSNGQLLTTDGSGNLDFTDVFDGFDIAFFISGSPISSQIVAQFVAVRAVSFPMNLTDSQGFASTAATASTDFDIQKNGGSIGTMNFAMSGTVATFTFASPVSFAAGDIFKVIAPASPDVTLADISMTFKGIRT